MEEAIASLDNFFLSKEKSLGKENHFVFHKENFKTADRLCFIFKMESRINLMLLFSRNTKVKNYFEEFE